jgi:hypothetical protein
LRLLFSPDLVAARKLGLALSGQGMEIRWSRPSPDFYGIFDGATVACQSGAALETYEDVNLASSLREDFETEWGLAAAVLDEALLLEDALQALPDPREKEPHTTRHRKGP